jgi:hypothetical protein
MNKKLEKVIAGVLIPSILAPSCTPNSFFDTADVVSINKQSDINSITIPINLTFDSRDSQILNFISKICVDIVENPVIAKQFAKNPTAFAETYGVADLQIDFDDGLWKLIVALGDEDIHEAIIKNDVSNFFTLCKQKGLIEEIQKSDILKYRPILANIDGKEVQAVSLAIALVAVGVVVLYGAAAVVVAGAAVNAAYAVSLITNTLDFWNGESSASIINRDPHILQLWTLKNGANTANTYFILSEYQEQLVNECIDALQTHFPEAIEKVDMRELRTLISLNLPK